VSDLCVTKLAKAFDRQAVLRGVDLSVKSGTLVAILGASGSGKTTLLRLIGGFERADSGIIDVGGQRIVGPDLHVPAARRRIGYVAQEGALFPHLSVADNITFGLPRQERRTRRRVSELLELVGLSTTFATRPPQALSGGEQQRVALARALAPAPHIVLLDEPFSALDAASRTSTRDAVVAALAAAETTALLVTHDQDEALSMGQEVAVLREGNLVQVADPETLYRRPADPAVARFVGEAMVLTGTVRDCHVECALGIVPVRTEVEDGTVDVLIRPEQLRLAEPGRAGTVPARVCHVTFYGHDAKVELRLRDGDVGQAIFARVAGHQIPALGAQVELWLEGDVMVYPTARSEDS